MSVNIKESQGLEIQFDRIKLATKNFTTVIGNGGYGKVYKGELSLSGKLISVAVKRLHEFNKFGQGNKEFLTELQLLSRYRHPNVVSLLGFCEEGREKILIYEYAEHGSLDTYLSTAKTTKPLSWKQRINICVHAARGLDFLHNHAADNHRVIHRDIKSSNILLDQNWKAMIADFGLSKIGRIGDENASYVVTHVAGTPGYCDPEYNKTEILTKESDVYSFGVVLFEVLCGRLRVVNVDDKKEYLCDVAPRYYEKGKLREIIDPDLNDEIGSESVNKFSKIAYKCLCVQKEGRPTMDLVLNELEEALKLHLQSAIRES